MLVALLGTLGCGSRPSLQPAEPPPAADSYVRACGACHGGDGRGGGPLAPALRARPTDLTLLAARNGGVFPRETVMAVLTGAREVASHGSREMPVWGHRFGPPSGPTAVAAFVTLQRLEAIVGHLAGIQRADPAATPRAGSDDGRR